MQPHVAEVVPRPTEQRRAEGQRVEIVRDHLEVKLGSGSGLGLELGLGSGSGLGLELGIGSGSGSGSGSGWRFYEITLRSKTLGTPGWYRSSCNPSCSKALSHAGTALGAAGPTPPPDGRRSPWAGVSW